MSISIISFNAFAEEIDENIEKDKKRDSDIELDYYEDSIINNGDAEIIIYHNGSFRINDADHECLMYPSDTSYTTIRIDGRNYIFRADTINRQGNYIIAVDENVIPGVNVRQKLGFVYNQATGKNDSVQISYDVVNNSGRNIEAGVRVMLDTMVSGDDGAHFYVPGYGGVINQETEFSGENIPKVYHAYDHTDMSSLVGSGTLYTNSLNKPDTVKFVSWRSVSVGTGNYWDYNVSSDEFRSDDSAIAIYYNPKTLANGASRNYSTYYGVGSVSNINLDGVGISVFAPEAMELNDDLASYKESPVTVNAYVENNKSTEIKNVKMKIILPQELLLVSGNEAVDIGNVSSYSSGSAEWKMVPKNVKEDSSFTYYIEYSSDGEESKKIEKSIFVPALRVPEIGDYFTFNTGNSQLWRCIDKREKENDDIFDDNDSSYLLMPVSNVDYKAFDEDNSTYSESDINNWLNDIVNGYFASTTISRNFLYRNITENAYKEIYNNLKVEELTSGSAVETNPENGAESGEDSESGSESTASKPEIFMANKIDAIPDNYDIFASGEVSCRAFLPGIEEMNKAYQLDNDFYKAWKTVDDYKNKNLESGLSMYWMSTPYNVDGENDKVCVINSSEIVGSAKVDDSSVGVRPVVWVKGVRNAKIVNTGIGDMDSPFVIKTSTDGSSGDIESSPEIKKTSGSEDEEDSEIMLGDVNGKTVAEEFMTQELAKFSEEEKQENTYLLTVLADEAVARSADISADRTQLDINDSMISNAARIVNSTADSVTNILEREGVHLQRRIKRNVRIVDNRKERININKKASEKDLSIDNVIVCTPNGSLVLDAEKSYDLSIQKKDDNKKKSDETTKAKKNNSSKSASKKYSKKVEDETEETTKAAKNFSSDNSVEKELVKKGTSVYSNRKKVFNEIDRILAGNSEETCQKIEVKFNTPSSEVIKVRFFGVEDGEYKAVMNEKGTPLGGKYNVITGELSAPIAKTGIFSYADNEKDFADLKSESAELREAVNSLASKGIVMGTAENEFSPDKSITRAETAAIILRMTLGNEGIDPNEDGGFIDVPKDCWYFGTAGTSKKEHLIEGYEDNTFRGNMVIPFEHIVSILGRTLENETYKTSDTSKNIIEKKYDNYDDVSDWARDNFALAIECGIIAFPENRIFDGDEEMTRGDAAISVYNVYKMLSD